MPSNAGFFYKLNMEIGARRYAVNHAKMFGVDFIISVGVAKQDVTATIRTKKTKKSRETFKASCRMRFSINHKKKPAYTAVQNGCAFPGKAVFTANFAESITLKSLQVDVEFLKVVYESGNERVILLDQSKEIFHPSLSSLVGFRVINQVQKVMTKLFEANYSKDCKLVLYGDRNLADPPCVSIHSCILQASTMIFERMPITKPDNKDAIVYFNDEGVTHEAIHCFASFLYGVVDPVVLCEHLDELLCLGHKYEIQHLVDLCVGALRVVITTGRVLFYLDLGDKLNMDSVRDICLDFLVKDAKIYDLDVITLRKFYTDASSALKNKLVVLLESEEILKEMVMEMPRPFGASTDYSYRNIDRPGKMASSEGFFHKLNICNRERRYAARTSPVKMFGVDFNITVAVTGEGEEAVVKISAEETEETITATCHMRFSVNKEKKPVYKTVKDGCSFPGTTVITGKLPASVTIKTLQVDMEFLKVVFGSGKEEVTLLDQSQGIFHPSVLSLAGFGVSTQVNWLTAKLFEANYSKDCKLVSYADCDLSDPPSVRIHSCILQSSSPCFAKLSITKPRFDNNERENPTNSDNDTIFFIDVQGITHETIQCFAAFLYGVVDPVIFCEHLVELLCFGHKYDIQDLVELCYAALKVVITSGKVLFYLEVADRLDMKTVMDICLKFLVGDGKIYDLHVPTLWNFYWNASAALKSKLEALLKGEEILKVMMEEMPPV